jgi:hypothetical protein
MNGIDNVLSQTETVNRTKYRLNNSYIGTLKGLFADCEIVERKLDKLPFSDDAMISIIKEYCQYVDPDMKMMLMPQRSKIKIETWC